MAHMLVFHSCLKMLMWASVQRTITYTIECARTHREMWACTHGPAETQRGRLNHIISTQIINDIIFSCSSYNVGQLDTGGNEEAQRGRWKRKGTKKIAEKQSVCMSDGKIQMTTKRMGREKKVWKCRKRDRGNAFREKLVSVCCSETGSSIFIFAQNICRTERIQQCARGKRLQHKFYLSVLSEIVKN